MQAYIYSITPFDATKGTIVHYNWTGIQSFVQIQIKDQDEQIIYSNNVQTNLKQIAIPANQGLENGHSYLAYITITDQSGRTNDNSEVGQAFSCHSTPTFQFNWTGTGAKVTPTVVFLSAYAFTFNVSYEQADGDRLNSWQINLYSSDHILLSSSGLIYNIPHTQDGTAVSANLSYQFAGFGDRGNYYIRARGKTYSGMSVDTDYVSLSSNYASKSVFSMLKADNIPEDGRIYIESSIVSAVCKVFKVEDGVPVEIPEDQLGDEGLLYSGDYIDPKTNQIKNGNHALKLLPGYYMTIDEGYSLGSFSNSLIFINPAQNKPLLTYTNADGSQTATLYYRVGKFSPIWMFNTPQDGDHLIVRYKDTIHGGYHYGWSTWTEPDGWGEVIVQHYDSENDTYYEAEADWATSETFDAWAYPIEEDQACFELIVSGITNTTYVSNVITKAAQDEKAGVVIVRDEYGRYNLIASDGFNLTTPKESYAASTHEEIG